jgi:hypothetical protein
MNRFQAMARIMAILCKDGRLQKGSQKYKLARKLIATKIDRMGPDAAYAKAKWNKYELLVEIDELHKADKAGKILGNFV